MSFDGASGRPRWVDDQMCDFCGHPKVHETALEFVEPGVMDENGGWTDKVYTKEKGDKWSMALHKAYDKLQKRCLCFYTYTDDDGRICRDCLEEFMNE